MITLILNVRQRLMLESVIRQQRAEDDMNALELLVGLRKKVGFSDEERIPFTVPFPDGTYQVRATLPSLDVPLELETAEMRKLASILKSLKLTSDDAELWYFDIRQKLQDAGFWK